LNPPAKNVALKRWNGSLLARIFTLATISLYSYKKITQEWKRGSERALLLLAGVFWFKMSKRGKNKKVPGYLYPLSQKIKRWVKGTRILRVYVRILRTWNPETPVPDILRMSNSDPETPGYCPDTPEPDIEPDSPDKYGFSLEDCF
jgi:hypothetical protein